MINPKKWQVVILAAGKSTRMNSKLHKSLVKIQGKNLLTWCTELAKKVCQSDPIVVVGYEADKIISRNKNLTVDWLVQNPPGGGTATSLFSATRNIDQQHLLVLYVDDAFLYTPENIIDLCREHEQKDNVLTLLTFKSKPLPVGGIISDANGRPIDTVDFKQAQEKGLTKLQILCGAIAIDRKWFENNFSQIKVNHKSERGLPELINIAYLQKSKVSSHQLEKGSFWQGVNTKRELSRARYLKIKQINNERIGKQV